MLLSTYQAYRIGVNTQEIAQKEFNLLNHPTSTRYLNNSHSNGMTYSFTSKEYYESIWQFYDKELSKNGWIFDKVDKNSIDKEHPKYFYYYRKGNILLILKWGESFGGRWSDLTHYYINITTL